MKQDTKKMTPYFFNKLKKQYPNLKRIVIKFNRFRSVHGIEVMKQLAGGGEVLYYKLEYLK